MAVQYIASNDPTLCGSALKREGRRQTGRRSAHAGSRLKLIGASGRSRLICQPSSRTGENPPYGMIGRVEETSASFEARSAPRSHPTWLCKNSRRYNRTRNFGLYGHAESKKTQKFVFRSALRPNQISFSHGQDPKENWSKPGHPPR